MARTPTADIPLGFEAPAFALTEAVTGTTVTSDDVFAGGPTVVVFMCNHCPFVVHILEGQKDSKDKKDKNSRTNSFSVAQPAKVNLNKDS